MTPDEMYDFEEEAFKEETGNDDYSLFVAGRVVSMWECNSDEKSTNCRQMHGGMKTLRHIEVSSSMLSDHAAESYKGNLRSLIENAKD
jgi:septation ring formation regulator EzrA